MTHDEWVLFHSPHTASRGGGFIFEIPVNKVEYFIKKVIDFIKDKTFYKNIEVKEYGSNKIISTIKLK